MKAAFAYLYVSEYYSSGNRAEQAEVVYAWNSFVSEEPIWLFPIFEMSRFLSCSSLLVDSSTRLPVSVSRFNRVSSLDFGDEDTDAAERYALELVN